MVTPTAATIDDPLFIPESQIQRQIDGAKSRIDEISFLFPPLADDVADPPPPPQATTIVYGYSPDDNVLILEDENDSETFTKYDAINRSIAVRVFRAGQTDSFIGDPIFAPNPKDDFDGPHRDTFPAVIGTNKNNYQYDGLSRLTRATDNNDPVDTSDDSLVTYAYDSLSRVIEETQQIGSLPVQATSSAWEADTRVGLIYPNGRELRYTYDGLDRIKAIAEDFILQPPLVEYDYIGVDRVLERRSPLNGTRMTYLNDTGDADIGYDGLRRTVQLRHLRDDNSLIVGFEYDYDRMNNRVSQIKLHDPDRSEFYTYDSVYRLINFERPDGTGNNWKLDGVGNWEQVDGETREHSSFNELISRQDGVTEDLRYDDNGNLIEDGDYLYEWDSRNRLRRATRKGDGVVAEYSYDAMGRRIIKDVSNSGALDGVTYLYHDGMREIEERDGSNVLKQQYVYGNYIDEVLVMDRNLNGDNSAISVGDQSFYYHQDALYSVYAVTDETGQIAESYLYDPYGKVTVFDENGVEVDDNVWGTANSAIGNPFLFTGRRLDEETGLYYYRARYYDADQGRLISRDPVGYVDGMNLYYYTKNNPLISVDPLGEDVYIVVSGKLSQKDAKAYTGVKQSGKKVTIPYFYVTVYHICRNEYLLAEKLEKKGLMLSRVISQQFEFTRHATFNGVISVGLTGPYQAAPNATNISAHVPAKSGKDRVELDDFQGRKAIQFHQLGASEGCFMSGNHQEFTNLVKKWHEFDKQDPTTIWGTKITVDIEAVLNIKEADQRAGIGT